MLLTNSQFLSNTEWLNETTRGITNMAQIFGDYATERSDSQEYLIIGFSPSSKSLKQRWRNNGLSADFLADYLTTFFPIDNAVPETVNRQAEIKSAISYIANELLENAMKFNDDSSQYPISVKLQLSTDEIIFYITNSVKPKQVEGFKAFIENLCNSDPQDLYIERLEANAENEDSTASGLGLLTMVNDYMAKLGWKFETIQHENRSVTTVTTMVGVVI